MYGYYKTTPNYINKTELKHYNNQKLIANITTQFNDVSNKINGVYTRLADPAICFH